MLILSVIASMGLCSGGTCGLMISDNKDSGALPVIVTISAYGAMALTWMGASFIWIHRRRIGRWFFVAAAALAWTALVVGFGVAINIGNRYSGTALPVMVWVFAFMLPGVFPITFAMAQAFSNHSDNHHNQRPNRFGHGDPP